ncbi:aminotransferase class V-fold PLP-dependent enzyme [Thalassotalea sp. PS06]|uniref:aminotransferase class V-fold PLP-dependent enzyme n=1 Tax=Thalassotalea sp. PS06 TaxID=2594005 RepID=UPI001163DAF0|nr:aminotransferase class V-fold PLP-dependent enzyme [Thalassotalea sp. PS06]QDP02334.1 aminotransferase class V-fold PLP-dependent enzyme [Thalassotalea sp. PS06]
MSKQDFHLPQGTYLLNHSVGRPLKSLQQGFAQSFLAPWQQGNTEPWGQWLGIIDDFVNQLADLFNSNASQFCPQVNLSSALTKLLQSLPQLNKQGVVILMAEQDFPSMGFAVQKSLPSADIRFIPKDHDITDANVWAQYLTADIDLVFVSHAYSNTGQLAPISDVITLATKVNALSILDIAQSAGVIPLDLQTLQPDFMIGSSVKWLCSGSGAAYLWINQEHIEQCDPIDVGWFSHENPFEFDIHHFKYHPTARRFWGGTPSIAPYAIAAHTLTYFNQLTSDKLREHNQNMLNHLWQHLADFIVSPEHSALRSGTAILQFAQKQQAVLDKLAAQQIAVDSRALGIRVSPHIFNDKADIEHFIDTVKSVI